MTNRLHQTLCREWVRERGESENQKTKRPRGQKGKKGKRTRVAEMAGLGGKSSWREGKSIQLRGGAGYAPQEDPANS